MNEIIDDVELEQEAEDVGSKWHSYLQSRLNVLLYKYYGEKFISFNELSLQLVKPYVQPNAKESFIVKPDIAIYSIQDKPLRKIDELTVKKLPLCVIEILSPRQALSDLAEKAKCYFQNEITSCWIIIPEFENIYVLNQSINDQETYTIKDKLIDKILGIELSVAEIFE